MVLKFFFLFYFILTFRQTYRVEVTTNHSAKKFIQDTCELSIYNKSLTDEEKIRKSMHEIASNTAEEKKAKKSPEKSPKKPSPAKLSPPKKADSPVETKTELPNSPNKSDSSLRMSISPAKPQSPSPQKSITPQKQESPSPKKTITPEKQESPPKSTNEAMETSKSDSSISFRDNNQETVQVEQVKTVDPNVETNEGLMNQINCNKSIHFSELGSSDHQAPSLPVENFEPDEELRPKSRNVCTSDDMMTEMNCRKSISFSSLDEQDHRASSPPKLAEKQTVECVNIGESRKSDEYEMSCVKNIDCQTSLLADVQENKVEPITSVELHDKTIENKISVDILNKSDSSLADENTKDKTLEMNKSDESFELNMSSVSAQNSVSPKKNVDEQEHELKSKPSILPDEDFQIRTMTRTNSESSLFSHISSVSEYYEKNRQNEEEEEEEERAKKTIKRRAPVNKTKDVLLRHMDDNELSITKASEEAAENSKKAPGGSSSLKRRKSDLSCSSGSSGASSAAAAKIKASIQKLPPTLGSNDQEIRVTRSKLKALIESPDVSSSSSGSSTKVSSAKVTRGSRKKLEIVEENEELLPSQTAPTTAKMSISNLRKHNAAMEKAEILGNRIIIFMGQLSFNVFIFFSLENF